MEPILEENLPAAQAVQEQVFAPAAPAVPDQNHNYSRSGRRITWTDKGKTIKKHLGFAVRDKAMRRAAFEPKFNGDISEVNELEVDEPHSYQEALNSKYSKFWMPAFEEEFEAHKKIGSFRLVPPSEIPPDAKAVPHKWVGKFKPGYGDVPPRFKGRLTVVGSSQRPGIDYGETFAPVARLESFRIFLALVASEDLEMVQIDIKTAFLSAFLDYPLYMTQPEGFVEKGREDDLCLVVRAIYGTKQASHLFVIKLRNRVIKYGFKQLTADGCVFVRIVGDEYSLLINYVDDCIYATNKPESTQPFLDFMSAEFDLRQLPPTRFLGINMQRDRPNRQIFISQEHTVLNMLEKYGMEESKPVLTPADPNARLSAQMTPPSEGEESTDVSMFPYSAAVGSLSYLAGATRLDISFAVGQVAKYSAKFLPAHVKAVKRIWRYLKGTSHLGIWIGGSNDGPVVYGDADFAGDLDNSKSTTGLIGFLRGGPVTWASRRQTTVATSTAHSEINALCEAAKTAVWLRNFNAEIAPTSSAVALPPAPPVTVYCDNQSAVKLSKNPEFHRRTKHFTVSTRFIRELQDERQIAVTEVDTLDQLADIFTKPLTGEKFASLRERLGMGSFANTESRV